jgi:hypothetical protein
MTISTLLAASACPALAAQMIMATAAATSLKRMELSL